MDRQKPTDEYYTRTISIYYLNIEIILGKNILKMNTYHKTIQLYQVNI